MLKQTYLGTSVNDSSKVHQHSELSHQHPTAQETWKVWFIWTYTEEFFNGDDEMLSLLIHVLLWDTFSLDHTTHVFTWCASYHVHRWTFLEYHSEENMLVYDDCELMEAVSADWSASHPNHLAFVWIVLNNGLWLFFASIEHHTSNHVWSWISW